MTRKEKTQQNRFDKKIEPLLQELAALCDKFGMPMLTAVQLFENEEEGARVSTRATHPKEMSLPMTLSTSLMNGTTKVRVSENNMLQLIMPKQDVPDDLKRYAKNTPAPSTEYKEDELEPLTEHAKHCDDCRILMEEAISMGERIDNIMVPKHDEAGILELIQEMKKLNIPFIMPKHDVVH